MSNPRFSRDHVLGQIACLILGGIFLFASYAKLFEPGNFVEQIHLEKLDFWVPATLIAVAVIFLETILGVFLLLGVTNRFVLTGSALLITFFLYLTGRNYWLVTRGFRDPDSSCGCFGSLIERTAAEAFWQDLVLLGLPILIAIRLLPRDFTFPLWRSIIAVVGSLAVALLMARSPSLLAAGDALRFAQEGDRDVALVSVPASVFLNQEEDSDAKVYLSETRASFVVLFSKLGKRVILDPRTRDVNIIGSRDLQVDSSGDLRLSVSPQLQSAGNYERLSDGIYFSVEEMKVRLVFR